jgi:hypothetical protein
MLRAKEDVPKIDVVVREVIAKTEEPEGDFVARVAHEINKLRASASSAS